MNNPPHMIWYDISQYQLKSQTLRETAENQKEASEEISPFSSKPWSLDNKLILSIKINDQLLPCKLSPDTSLDSHTKTNILGACVTRKSNFYLKLRVLHWWPVWIDMKCKWGRGQARPWTNTNTCSPWVVDFNIPSQAQLDTISVLLQRSWCVAVNMLLSAE